jgi:hypothetical protein
LLIGEPIHPSPLQTWITETLGVWQFTLGRVLPGVGVSMPRDVAPRKTVQLGKHALPGDSVHPDTKKLGRIGRTIHRATGNGCDPVAGAAGVSSERSWIDQLKK